MKKTGFLLIMALLLTGCSGGLKVEKDLDRDGGKVLVVRSPAILKNKLGFDEPRLLGIYLPPGYEQTERRYPVIYYLHGFRGNGAEIFAMKHYFDEWFTQHPDKACLIVGIDGGGPVEGCFYVNSKLAGNWEDFVVEETVALIDSRFRTLATPGSRAISGFSMGGSGAIKAGMKHPDVYGVLYAVSPGLFDENGLENALAIWIGDKGFIKAYGTVFGYDPALPEPHYQLPLFDGSEEDRLIQERWERGFGNLEELIAEYQAGETSLASFQLLYGERDGYVWIRNGTEYFSSLLRAAGIQHELHIHPAGHIFLVSSIILKEFLPDITGQLDYGN